MDYSSPENANKLLFEYRSEYSNNDIDYERKRFLRSEIYNIENWLETWAKIKCENHYDFDTHIYDKYELFIYKNCDGNGVCKKCGVQFKFCDDLHTYNNLKNKE